VVWRLDRLGRGLKHLIELIASLEERQIAFRSLRESIDTTTPARRLAGWPAAAFGALAEFERVGIVHAARLAGRAMLTRQHL
jgi:DNA invertase Pin-like site-specific DNA recombinase